MKKLRLIEDDFKPYFDRENDFKRLLLLHSIAAYIFCPIFGFIIYNSELPSVYFYLSLSYAVLFPFYVLITWFVKVFNKNLIYFFIIHSYLMSIIAVVDLIWQQFDLIYIYSFFCLYALTVFVLQRFIPALIYNVIVIIFLTYGLYITENTPVSKPVIISYFILLTMISTLVYWSRQKMIHSIEQYAGYLKMILHNPGLGYVLFTFKNGELIIKDCNNETLNYFNINRNQLENELQNTFFKLNITSSNIFKHLNEKELTTFLEDKCFKFSFYELHLKRKNYFLLKIIDVSKEEKEKQEIIENESKYRDLYYRNQAGVFTTEIDSKIIDCNQSFIEMFENELNIGDFFINILHQKSWNEIIEMIYIHGKVKNYQTHIQLKNNTIKWFVFNWFVDHNKNQIIGTITDVTIAQKASIALSKSEEKYRLIYQDSNDAILLLDGEKIVDINRKSIQLFGLNENKLLGKSIWDFSEDLSKENKELFEKHINKLNFSKYSKFNWNFVSNQQIIETFVTITELNIGDKNYHQCVIHDLTESNKRLRIIEKTNLSLKYILENVPDGIIIIQENKIVYTNPEIFKILGVDEIDLEKLFTIKELKAAYEKHLESGKNEIFQTKYSIIETEVYELSGVWINSLYEEKDSNLLVLRNISTEQKILKEKVRAEFAEETNKSLIKEINERMLVEKRLQEQFLRSSAIFNSSQNTFMITLNKELNISYYNVQCKHFFKSNTNKNIEKGLSFLFFLKDFMSKEEIQEINISLEKVLKKESIQFISRIETKDQQIWLENYFNPIYDIEGKVKEISIVLHDITDKKNAEISIINSLKEKEILLKEIHHRVKNNMQVISSILNLQSSYITDKKTIAIFEESKNRIRTMAIVHENLYQSNTFSSINFSKYIQNLGSNIIASYFIKSKNIHLELDLEDIELVLDQAIPAGLIINEIMTNSMKYAFTDQHDGEILISLKERNSQILLEISDDGIGLPEGFNLLESQSLGLQLVHTLVEQLDGCIEINSLNGLKYLITFDKVKI